MPQPPRDQHHFEVSIAKGDQFSTPVQLGGLGRALFHIPGEFTGSTAMFLGSKAAGASHTTLAHDGDILVVNITTDAWHQFPPAVLTLHSVKIGSMEIQTAARTIKISGQT